MIQRGAREVVEDVCLAPGIASLPERLGGFEEAGARRGEIPLLRRYCSEILERIPANLGIRRAGQLEHTVEQRDSRIEHAANLIDDSFGVERLGLEVHETLFASNVSRGMRRSDRLWPLGVEAVNARLTTKRFRGDARIRIVRCIDEEPERLGEHARLLQRDAFGERRDGRITPALHVGSTSTSA